MVEVEVLVDRGVCGRDLLQGLDITKPRHRSLPSAKRLVGVLGPVIGPSNAGPSTRMTDRLHRGTIQAEWIGDNFQRTATEFHRPVQKGERRLASPMFRGKNFRYLAAAIHCASHVRHFPVDAHEHRIKMPESTRIRSMMNMPLAELDSKHAANRFHHKCTVSWQTSIPSSNRMSSTWCSDRRVADVQRDRQADLLR